ncbi:Vps54-like protein-domain-containing protein [Kickxella alabastrina]|uniref:Vps54-like protein-domain-containing protein n=1 Tax=Kickxella alabastrina TaxID=61397 RepID=UPI0022210679|nr:Vps54-like protein-domain-containing protein [Kickxella alabastrina]KAI7827797.1 Vps54-like protein-domain-containing protein [Kickxella alabastrina]
MKRQTGIGIIRQGADGGSSYFQRRVQPVSSTAAAAAIPQPQQAGPQQPQQADPPSDKTADAKSSGQSDQAARLHGLNAIAVLTNHPNKAPARIHRNELPAVARTHYPKIKSNDFDTYLDATTALYEQYTANTKAGYHIAADGLDRYEAAVEDARSHTYSMDSTTMAERLKTLDATRSEFGLDSISEYGGRVPSTAAMPGIDDVPTIFFEESFDLRDPATFDIATQVVLGPQSATDGLFAPDRAEATSALMQETLSEYMDIVEAYLTREISRRSPAFFAALSTLEELHAETDRCIDNIHVLRADLKRTALTQCSPGLEMIRLRRRQDHLASVLSDVELLSNLRHIQPTIDELVASGDCIGALNLITEAQAMIDPNGLANPKLKDTNAFKILNAHMLRSLSAVSSFAEQELAAIVLRDMREFVDDGLSSTADGLLGRSQVDIYQVNLAMQLTPFVCGLVRTGSIANALKSYRDCLMSESAALIEALYPSDFPRSKAHAAFNDASQQRVLGTATFDQFRTMLGQQQELLLLLISHISMVRRAILAADVLRSLNDTFDAFMDVAHVRCAKLLNHRSEQNARLSLVGFHSLYTSIWHFITQYEALGGKMCFGLRGTLTAQAKAFLSNFHTEKSRQIQILIENDNGPLLLTSSLRFGNKKNSTASLPSAPAPAPASGLGSTPLANSPLALRHQNSAGLDAASIRSVDTAAIGLMHIGGEAFHVVGCSLVLVKSVVEYLQCAINIPCWLVEVFKAFNSRTCQVVLGAGAMRSAALALASESLSLCMELIPYVKECLRHAMSPSQEVLLAQLDRIVSDFSNHQSELHRKLVAIMADRADYHGRVLATTKWDEIEHSAQPPVPAMDALVKEVRKLHKVLKRYLPPPALRSIFAQIFSMYETKLTAQYQKIRITSGEGKRQLMLNSQFLLRRLRALDSSLSVDWELEVVVNNIDLVKPYQPALAVSASPVPTSQSLFSPTGSQQPSSSDPPLSLVSPMADDDDDEVVRPDSANMSVRPSPSAPRSSP